MKTLLSLIFLGGTLTLPYGSNYYLSYPQQDGSSFTFSTDGRMIYQYPSYDKDSPRATIELSPPSQGFVSPPKGFFQSED